MSEFLIHYLRITPTGTEHYWTSHYWGALSSVGTLPTETTIREQAQWCLDQNRSIDDVWTEDGECFEIMGGPDIMIGWIQMLWPSPGDVLTNAPCFVLEEAIPF